MKSVSYFKQLLVITLISSAGLLSPNFSFAQPPNDDCAGAILLTSNAACSNTAGTVVGATLSAGIPAPTCGSPTYDVWYSFVPKTIGPVITLSGVGFSFTNPHMQLLSGTCGALAQVGCGTTTITAANLTVGQTYYIRVFSTSGSAPSSNGGFSICITETPSTIDKSKSYINISKGNNGGTIDPGDTLEMRLTFVINKTGVADSLSFEDTLYNGGGLRFVPGSITLRTNEGIVYKTFTDAFDADAGYIKSVGVGPDTVVHINFGAGASNVARGKLRNNSKPSVFGNTCIIMATYRVIVTAGYNTKIPFKTGVLTYRDSLTNKMHNFNWPVDSFVVYKSPGLCPNAISVNNAIGAEFNGTFGTASGAAPVTRNRGTSAFTSYIYFPITAAANGPQDYDYAIVNNTAGTWTAATYPTLQSLAKPDASSVRVFQQWDIIGDHTGSTTGKGNPPCDTTNAVSASNPCGYMLVINSAYKADTAFHYTVTNLCESTNYEISAWFRNICYKCACDSNGVGASSAGYVPGFPGDIDSSGVQPNIAFDVNGTDYYTTGNLKYMGLGTNPRGTDTTNKWVKKGFTYTTAPGQTSFNLTLRNNAPGGGGNDWALDDISVFTCLPNMIYSPNTHPSICQGNYIQVNDTIRSYFNNWVQYKWQKSTNGGTTYTDIVGANGTGSPVLVGSNYQYISSYTIPYATTADSGTKFRVIVATNPTNIADSNCNVTDGTSIITLSVYNCGIPLATELLSFNGKLINGYGNLYWSTTHEEDNVVFEIQKSFDGINFKKIRNVNGKGGSSANYYNLMDSVPIASDVWYRVILINKKGDAKSSHIIQLSNQTQFFDVTNVVNPFAGRLMFDVTLTQDGKVDAAVLTLHGNLIRQQSFNGYNGVNSYYFQNLDALAPGVYILQVRNKDKTVTKKIVRQ